MPDREKVIKEYENYVNSYISLTTSHDYEFEMHKAVLDLLKEQDELLHKKQKDIDRLCNEISEWKHKYYDRTFKEQEAKPPAIMQDIEGIWSTCSMCGHKLRPILAMKMDTYLPKFCSKCGQAVKWE